MAEISGRVGGRNVIASGSVVLGPRDVDAAIKIDNLLFEIVFAQSEDSAVGEREALSETSIRILIKGKTDQHGHLGWDFPELATFNGQQLDLNLMTTTISGGTDRGFIRFVSYTFSTRAAG